MRLEAEIAVLKSAGRASAADIDADASFDSSTTAVGSSDDGDCDGFGRMNDGIFCEDVPDAEQEDYPRQANEQMRSQAFVFGGSR